MEVNSPYPVLQLSRAQVESVRQACNLQDEAHIQQSTASIREWYRLQPHMLKEDLDPAFTERVLMLARGSVELAKSKIDAIATVRAALPEFYSDRQVDSLQFRKLAQFVKAVPLPTLNTDLTRIVMVRMRSDKVEPGAVFNPMSYFKFILLIADNRMYLDYVTGDTYVVDMQHLRLSDFTAFNISVIKKIQIITSAYSMKLKGIHFINAPAYIDKAVFILKQGLKEKLAKRIRVHSSLEEFYKFVPRQHMPADYGGPHPSLDELYDNWIRFLRSEDSIKLSEDANQLRTDETKRTGGKVDEDMLGIPGSFRTLSVD